jgi:NADH:ubiquinone oxidoreductase subunit 4 (subunit M)
MLIATVISLAYSLRFTSKVFLGQPKSEEGEVTEEGREEKTTFEVSNYMKLSFAILVVLIILVGIYPTFFLNLIQTAGIG